MGAGAVLRPRGAGQSLGDGGAHQVVPARVEVDFVELAAALWPVDDWAAHSRALLAHVARVDRPADRLTGFAAVVRQLLTDPVLPPELLPSDWPGAALRSAYAAYQAELAQAVPQDRLRT
jgi:phenylacetic acid degradation operon negative regulatory protein